MKTKYFPLVAAALSLTGAFAGSQAFAQDYPAKEIKMIVPFAAGGPTDTLGRALAEAMSTPLGEKVIVENKPGAGGNVGSAQLAHAAADGYTIMLVTNGPVVANQLLFKDMAFDPKRDFAPVSLVTYLPNMVAVNPSVPANTIKELIALLKANPGKYSYGSGGLGTSSHFAGELFKTMAQVDMEHVPYKGDGASMPDAVGGHIPIVFGSVFAAHRFTESGMLRGLAVTSRDRVPSVKDMPTVEESGDLKGFDLAAWYGVVAPAGTPLPIIEKLSQTIRDIVASPSFQERVVAMGGIPRSATPAEFAEFIETERPKWEGLIKESGIKID